MKTILTAIQILKKYILCKKKNICMIFIYLILSALFNFFQPLVSKVITDKGLINKDIKIVVIYVFILLLLVSVNGFIDVLFTNKIANIKNDSEMKIYNQVLTKLEKIKYEFFLDKNSSEIIDMLMLDINSILSIIDTNSFSIINDIFRILSGLCGLLMISPVLTVIILLVIPIKYICAVFFSSLQKRKTKKYIYHVNKFTSVLAEYISGMKEIRLWNIFDYQKENLLQRESNLLKRKKEFKMIVSWNNLIERILEGLVTGCLYIIGVIFLIKNELTLGGLFAFISYSGYVTTPIMSILNFKMIFAQIMPSLERFSKFMDNEEENICGNSQIVEGDINIRNLTFSYGDHIIFDDVSITIPKKSKVAIIGDNGSGKSTLINIILRFIDAQKGSIDISGIDISTINIKEYRKMFSVVSQDSYIFNKTIKDNIDLYNLNNPKLLQSIYDKCQLNKMLEKLSQKEETIIGTNGAKLSNGERQKIAVARTFIKNTPFLVLDEPSTGYDEASREYLRKLLMNDMNDKTVILITHDYKDLDGVDIIFKIEDKKIIRIKK